jgi:serine/threonine protein kinase
VKAAEREKERFGPYEIVSKLGVGGMAETYVAVRRGPGGFAKEVCLKRVLPAFADDENFQKMFFAEAKIAARLRHGQVVQLHDFGEIDGAYFLALELVDGVDLRKLLRAQKAQNRALDLDLAIYVFHELLAALSYVHAVPREDGALLGLVHRDISPANVLLSKNGEVKLADFGVAKATNAPGTASVAVKGKIAYMAPEQFELRADARSDLFALAVLTYEMLAGRRPFEAPTDAGTMMKIVKGEFVSLSIARPDAPPVLASAIDRLLSVRAEDRFESADAVLDAIAEVIPGPAARNRLGTLVRAAAEDRAPPPPPSPSASGVRETGPSAGVIPKTIALEAAVQVAPPPMASTPVKRRALVPVIAGIGIVIAAGALGAWAAWSGSEEPDTEGPSADRERGSEVEPPAAAPAVREVAPTEMIEAGVEPAVAPEGTPSPAGTTPEAPVEAVRADPLVAPASAEEVPREAAREATREAARPNDRTGMRVARQVVTPPVVPPPPTRAFPDPRSSDPAQRTRPGSRAEAGDLGL